ncbi:Retrovirus-related Pol polyprotein from transposon 412 [Vitis vinifera]|uniref:Retrovirus-related Pol polyprotein from transposon 412 n=1 Tax=Vitis vinifera TaxID=29760 RepID=A0A438CI70_VITVI|nr:Retrovirus-related Pol polyprotein from transposon 412 [Vitis vinifera]
MDKPLRMISTLRASSLLRKGCQGFLAYVVNKENDLKLEDIPIVRDYPDVFPDDLLGLAPQKKVEFTINLALGSTPISKAPYRMAPMELKELKIQLQELLDKGFIRPSVLSLGALVFYKVSFLGPVVTKDGIFVDLRKVDVVSNWIPNTVIEIQSFLGLASYYRRFIEGFSKIALPLTRLTQKGVKFEWSYDYEHSFQELKNRLMIAPILTIPSGSGGFVVYSDASR